jgi:hypothetical protein
MPIQDWTRVPAAIFHDFHHELVSKIARDLNDHVLASDCYALVERVAAGFSLDTLALDSPTIGATDQPMEDEMAFYRRKKNWVVVRQVSDDRVVAVVDVVSPGNKSTRSALEETVRKAAELLDRRLHLLIIDLLPPGRHDPHGIHGEIWGYVAGRAFVPPPEKPLTLASYEAGPVHWAFVESVAVGDSLPEMPLFLQPGHSVNIDLEHSQRGAWEGVPHRWKDVIEAPR